MHNGTEPQGEDNTSDDDEHVHMDMFAVHLKDAASKVLEAAQRCAINSEDTRIALCDAANQIARSCDAVCGVCEEFRAEARKQGDMSRRVDRLEAMIMTSILIGGLVLIGTIACVVCLLPRTG